MVGFAAPLEHLVKAGWGWEQVSPRADRRPLPLAHLKRGWRGEKRGWRLCISEEIFSPWNNNHDPLFHGFIFYFLIFLFGFFYGCGCLLLVIFFFLGFATFLIYYFFKGFSELEEILFISWTRSYFICESENFCGSQGTKRGTIFNDFVGGSLATPH